MNINLTISVDHPEELPRVLQYLARSFETTPAVVLTSGALDPSTMPMHDKPRRGRPAKVSEEFKEKVAEEFKSITPQPADAVAEEKAAAPAAATYERKDVQKLLVAVVQKHGVAACSEICLAHGAPNLSGLDPAVYPDVVAAAQKKLAAEADPAA